MIKSFNNFNIIKYVSNKHKGQKYGNVDYIYHILNVKNTCDKFINKYKWTDKEKYIIEMSAYCHDLLEDTNTTYEELVNNFGKEIAKTVYNLSGFGDNRKTRILNSLNKIKNDKISIFVKLCDRISNTENSIDNPKKLKMYKKEYPLFKKYLKKDDEFIEMWNYLDTLNNI